MQKVYVQTVYIRHENIVFLLVAFLWVTLDHIIFERTGLQNAGSGSRPAPVGSDFSGPRPRLIVSEFPEVREVPRELDQDAAVTERERTEPDWVGAQVVSRRPLPP